MKKKKAVIERWCPLTGQYTHLKYDHVIQRARALWSRPGVELRTLEGRIIPSLSFTGEAIEKARAIYEKWEQMQRDTLNLERLQDYIGLALDPEIQNRERYVDDILFWFADLDASGLEVFSILAIHEARVTKNDAWPVELLALTERYSPSAMRSKQVMNGASEGGKARAAQARIDRELAVKDWQARAEKLWAQSPALLKSKLETAKKIRRELLKENSAAPSITTIRQNIKKAHRGFVWVDLSGWIV